MGPDAGRTQPTIRSRHRSLWLAVSLLVGVRAASSLSYSARQSQTFFTGRFPSGPTAEVIVFFGWVLALVWVCATLGLLLRRPWGRACGILAAALSLVSLLPLGLVMIRSFFGGVPFGQGPHSATKILQVCFPLELKFAWDVLVIVVLCSPRIRQADFWRRV